MYPLCCCRCTQHIRVNEFQLKSVNVGLHLFVDTGILNSKMENDEVESFFISRKIIAVTEEEDEEAVELDEVGR